MEQLIYDSSISDSFLSLRSSETDTNLDVVAVPGLSQQAQHQIIQQLTSTIDLHKLASIYFQLLQQHLNILQIKIQFPTGSLTLGDADKSRNIRALDLSSQRRKIATVHYVFSATLTIHQVTLLNNLHRLVRQPLIHALEFHTLKQLAMKDHLTSLGNRAGYQESLHRMISQANRDEQPFGLLLIDMDHFKQINDNFGHVEGDQVLMAMAEVLNQSLRDSDYAFRFGGDEFCCLLPSSDLQTNQTVAERIQHSMRSSAILNRHSVSCSIGSACFTAGDSEQSLFKRADAALYRAKDAGKSCIEAA